ncbi:MAG: DUF488 domain-containing protein [Sphingomonas sp.]
MLATIGYERSTLADFVATLQLAKIDTLVDVRERAQSRRPGFSKKSLGAALQHAGIDYLHLPELGDPKAGREAARAGNVSLFLEIYNAVINGPKAQEALGQLELLASKKKVCLMCFERDQKDCHRKIVAEDLEKRLGIKATHWGVVTGAACGSRERRMLHTDQGAAASIQ